MPADREAEAAPDVPGPAMPSMSALLAAGAAAEAVCTPPSPATETGPGREAPQGPTPDQRDAA